MAIEINASLVEKFGGLENFRSRVQDFRVALEEHKKTVDIPAPTEEELIEKLAQTKLALEDIKEEPKPLPPPPPPSPRFIDSSSIVSRLMQPEFASKIKLAVETDVQMWAFWQRLLGRQKLVDTNDPEFPLAWKLLEATIGKEAAAVLLTEVLAERQ